uniref:DUF4178 domain-containing protein n=1 Tax=Caenorhabditis tropicalis TaxID=1561998 RepID=A0A1I7V3U7_9PELO
MVMIIRRYDIPISYRWYEIVMEIDVQSHVRKIYLDSALVIEDNAYKLIDRRIDIEGKKVLIADCSEKLDYVVTVDDKPLAAHIEDHSKIYSTWEVTLPGGAKTKVVANRKSELETVYFRGKKLPGLTRTSILSGFWKLEWSYQEVEFKIEFRLEGTWSETLVMNKCIVPQFKPSTG